MDIYNEGGIRYVHHLEQALRAHTLFKKDRHYVVKDGEVVIIDDFTGRLMFGRRYSEGLHQAIEAKEGVKVQQESRTLATITFQNYFRMYKKLAGMTGTAFTNAEEFSKVYNLEVVMIPTNKPMVRQDLPDKIFRSEQGKFQAVVKEIKERYESGQPVLVGTVSIERNELLSAHLKKAGIPHNVLNAKNHEQEAQIIANAGQQGAVTVATNMAGRGVDIKLGEGVVEVGGLHILGTERHEARRIDNQLRGRAGRQGDPGSSQFFVSMEDDLMRIFGSDRLKRMMEVLNVPEDMPIENKMVSRAIEAAQAKIEGFNFDTRKHVLEYDDVMNKQRQKIYGWRKKVIEIENEVAASKDRQAQRTQQPRLESAAETLAVDREIDSPSLEPIASSNDLTLRQNILDAIEKQIHDLVEFSTQSESGQRDLKEIYEAANSIFPLPINAQEKLKEFKANEEIAEYLIESAKQAYEIKEKEVGENIMRQIEKAVMLRTIDTFWMEHLDNMDHLRDSVRLRAYGQKDPLVEYKNEGHRLFQNLLVAIEFNVARTIYKVTLAKEPQSQRQEAPLAQAKENRPSGASASKSGDKTLGRNDPCWCGSGKKFKKCHGR
ncbi:MAG: SEC-C domain-containing protein [Candidatus Portnoybacteria bacterium]|nr:SEC-C domain-containing protein [Candidatus Portnoybacteria bacterium]